MKRRRNCLRQLFKNTLNKHTNTSPILQELLPIGVVDGHCPSNRKITHNLPAGTSVHMDIGTSVRMEIGIRVCLETLHQADACNPTGKLQDHRCVHSSRATAQELLHSMNLKTCKKWLQPCTLPQLGSRVFLPASAVTASHVLQAFQSAQGAQSKQSAEGSNLLGV